MIQTRFNSKGSRWFSVIAAWYRSLSATTPVRANYPNLGSWGEAYTVFQLELAGLRIVAQNQSYRCGEIDIIASRTNWLGQTDLHFCEVKTRSSRQIRAASAVDERKQIKIQRAAARFLRDRDWQVGEGLRCQFDIAEVYYVDNIVEFKWTTNAFEVDPEIFLF